jgi:1,5-anhydro-D-fructose reductase (1,5-anhydro-D-mannitol-forming)
VTEPMRWALIGASTIAHEYVIPALRDLPDAEILGVFSASAERGRSYADAHDIPRAYVSLEECLADPSVDAVYISTTNDLHAHQTQAAARAGKHVLCDKPLATTLAEADAMVAACEEAGVVFATNHHLPNSPAHRALRRLIQDGALGELRAMRVHHARWLPPELQSWRTSSPSSGAGVIFDVTVHDAALVRFLLDEEIVAASATSSNQGMAAGGIEDAVMGVMTTASGLPVQFHDAWTVPHAGTGLEVHGSEASAISRETMTSDPTGALLLRRGDDIEEIDLGEREDLYRRALRKFHGAVRGGGEVAVSGRDGREALRVALAVREAAADRCEVAVRTDGKSPA